MRIVWVWLNEDNVAITVPDHTRPIDSAVVLDALQHHLTNITTVVVGLGNCKLTKLELNQYFGVETIGTTQSDDCTMVDMVDGCCIGIFNHLMSADWTLTVGTIEVHQYAGVSGGYKGVVVGCGSRESIVRLHSIRCVPSRCASGAMQPISS